MNTYPRTNDQGQTVWACCESTIGPICAHRAEMKSNPEPGQSKAWGFYEMGGNTENLIAELERLRIIEKAVEGWIIADETETDSFAERQAARVALHNAWDTTRDAPDHT